jgi:hypothetical protein
MHTKEDRLKKIEQRGLKIKFIFFSFFSFFFCISAQAQCAMCRAALESEEGGVQAEAVNDGIVYLMAIPYILVGILGFAIYRLKYNKKKSV